MENDSSDFDQAEASNYLQENQTSHHQVHHHTIDVCNDEPYSESQSWRLAALEKKLATPPRLLSHFAGRSTCSIFKVPHSFLEVNAKYYHPQSVSIGPFHNGKPHLQMIQEHKYRYLSLLLARSRLKLLDLFQTLESDQNRARESYSEEIPLESHDFIELLVVDGCFVIELFRKVAKLVPIERDDPVLAVSWLFSFLMRDLLLLENQIPFFVLQKLFDLTRGTNEWESRENASLVDICFGYFSYSVKRPTDVIHSLRRFQAKHLLDLCRTSFIPTDLESKNTRDVAVQRNRSSQPHVIHCISKLQKAGIEIRPPTNKSGSTTFLDVRFRRNGVIEMPTVSIDDFMCSFYANCVAYEISQYKCSKYFTTYTALLDYLVNSYKDVEYLSDQNVIDNYLGTDVEVAEFINNLGKESPFDWDNCYLQDLFDEANHYHQNNWNVHIASFKYTYFRTPWSFISAFAALILLILSILQALYGMLGYYGQQQQQHSPN